MVQNISRRESALAELEESEYDGCGVGVPRRIFHIKVDWGT